MSAARNFVSAATAFYREMSAKGVLFSMPPKKQDFGGVLARGPESFFFAGRRSPGMIWGRSSCAEARGGTENRQASAARAAAREEIPQCKILREAGCLAVVTGALELAFSGEIPMNINDKAPDFTLQDENGKDVALKDLRGKTVVLFFYPRANTPG